MNLQAHGVVGCSITFAIHLIASQTSRRPFTWLVIATILGAVLVVPAPPRPPAPPTPSVPAMALVKGAK
jgi:hypothetical protein